MCAFVHDKATVEFMFANKLSASSIVSCAVIKNLSMLSHNKINIKIENQNRLKIQKQNRDQTMVRYATVITLLVETFQGIPRVGANLHLYMC